MNSSLLTGSRPVEVGLRVPLVDLALLVEVAQLGHLAAVLPGPVQCRAGRRGSVCRASARELLLVDELDHLEVAEPLAVFLRSASSRRGPLLVVGRSPWSGEPVAQHARSPRACGARRLRRRTAGAPSEPLRRARRTRSGRRWRRSASGAPCAGRRRAAELAALDARAQISASASAEDRAELRLDACASGVGAVGDRRPRRGCAAAGARMVGCSANVSISVVEPALELLARRAGCARARRRSARVDPRAACAGSRRGRAAPCSGSGGTATTSPRPDALGDLAQADRRRSRGARTAPRRRRGSCRASWPVGGEATTSLSVGLWTRITSTDRSGRRET